MSEELIFRGAYLGREYLHLKINWASLIVGNKFTVFALFYFVFDGSFPSTSPHRAYILRGDLTESFLCYRFGGLIIIWRGLHMERLIFGILRYIQKRRQRLYSKKN